MNTTDRLQKKKVASSNVAQRLLRVHLSLHCTLVHVVHLASHSLPPPIYLSLAASLRFALPLTQAWREQLSTLLEAGTATVLVLCVFSRRFSPGAVTSAKCRSR